MRFIVILLSAVISVSALTASAFSADMSVAGLEVANVNGVSLTEAELAQEIKALLPAESPFHSGVSAEKMKAIRAKALTALVEAELKYQDALARGMKLSKKELESEIASLSSGTKSAEFTARIAASGFTDKTFKTLVERVVLAKKVKEVVVDGAVKVTDATVADFYEKNKNRYVKPEEFTASHILVDVDPSLSLEEKEKAKQRAEAILKRLRAGADFTTLATEESDGYTRIKGGDLGTFHAGQVVPEFEAAVKALKPGDVSDIVETIYGFHIIKLTDKKESRLMSLDELKSRLKVQLQEAEETRLYNEWMSGLKAKAKITYPKEG